MSGEDSGREVDVRLSDEALPHKTQQGCQKDQMPADAARVRAWPSQATLTLRTHDRRLIKEKVQNLIRVGMICCTIMIYQPIISSHAVGTVVVVNSLLGRLP